MGRPIAISANGPWGPYPTHPNGVATRSRVRDPDGPISVFRPYPSPACPPRALAAAHGSRASRRPTISPCRGRLPSLSGTGGAWPSLRCYRPSSPDPRCAGARVSGDSSVPATSAPRTLRRAPPRAASSLPRRSTCANCPCPVEDRPGGRWPLDAVAARDDRPDGTSRGSAAAVPRSNQPATRYCWPLRACPRCHGAPGRRRAAAVDHHAGA